jgi:hypothetical protein
MTDTVKKLLKVRGSGGSVTVYADSVVIAHRGLLGGFGGEKTIPLANITSIRLRKAGFFRGCIQFGVAGAMEQRVSLFGRPDPNTVVFGFLKTAAFVRLKAYVEKLQAQARTKGTATSSVVQEPAELARLHEQGVLSDVEFQSLKEKLLN